MRTPVLIFPVKGQILRMWGEGGKKWQNFADVLHGRRPETTNSFLTSYDCTDCMQDNFVYTLVRPWSTLSNILLKRL